MKRYEGYALVTGGSSGIGLAFANELAAQGYDLVLIARDKSKLAKAKQSLEMAYSVNVIIILQDLAKPESTKVIFNFLKKKHIHIGLLINAAGFGGFGYFDKIDHAKTLDMINLMCLGYTDLTFKFLPAMLERSSGGIVFISSIVALLPAPLFSVYAASKAYSLKLGNCLHTEYASRGIDILSVCPGFVDTNFHKVSNTPRAKVNYLPPEEVAKRAMKALGNEVMITVPSDFSQRIAPFLFKLFPLKFAEKLVKKWLKSLFNVDL